MVTKCKNSVFAVLFLVCFLLGSLCGVLLLRMGLCQNAQWIIFYCRAMDPLTGIRLLEMSLLWACPMLLVVLIGFMSWQRLLPWLIAVRGLVLSYTMAAYWSAGLSLWAPARRNVVLLPLFYALCCWVWCHRVPISFLRGTMYESTAGIL